MLTIVPIFQTEAFQFVTRLHRHHKKPVGSVFQIAVKNDQVRLNCKTLKRQTSIKERLQNYPSVRSYYDEKTMSMFKNHLVNDRFQIVGVVVCGRPNGRRQQDGFTLEVTRLCTDGTKNVCSMLYSAAWRVAKNLGYRKLLTYILESEPGTSLKASGWKLIGIRGGGSWSVPSRPRDDKHPLEDKKLFEIT